MKVVLDANVFVSFLLTRSPTISKIIQFWKNNEFTLLVSDEILVEYKSVLVRIVGKGLLLAKEANYLFDEISKESLEIQVVSTVAESPDRKDNRYLACARDGKANYLVTGDKKHLLPLKNFGITKIISPAEFVEILEKTI